MDNKDAQVENKKYPAREIIEAVKSIDYGEVVIAIHDSRVVQIEKREKKRFK